MSSSIYEALPREPGANYIRVCELQPGYPDEPLQIELRTHCINSPDAEEYEAISWVWGSPSNSTTLKYRGQSIAIRKNLEDALRIFRYVDQPRTLWADAICINQEDQDERSAQVAIMGEIFSHAVEVLVWLGNDPEQQSTIVFDEVERQFSLDSVTGPVLFSVECMLNWSAHVWQAVNALYANPWFTRVWIQQEMGLAEHATFYWGLSIVPRYMVSALHNSIVRGLYADDRIDGLLSNPIMNISSTLRTRNWNSNQSMEPRFSFVRLLYVYRHLAATDPRDYIYGILSHPSAREPGSRTNLLVTPDYSKTVESVYLSAMKAMLIDPRSTGLQPLLLIHHTADTLLADVPSWVAWLHHPSETCPEQDSRAELPLSHSRWQIPPPNLLPDLKNMPFTAGDSLEVELDMQEYRLNISGTIFDSLESVWMDPKEKLLDLWVAHLLESNSISTIPTGLVERLGDNLPTLAKWLEATPYEDIIFAAASTLTRGYTFYENRLLKAFEHPEMFRNSFLSYLNQETGLFTQASSPPDDDPLPNMLSFSKFANISSGARSFARSEKGFFGLVPTIAAQGDCIAVFSGVIVPYVLRPVSDGVYKIVGHCYVQGIMYGEAIRTMQDRGETTTNLVII